MTSFTGVFLSAGAYWNVSPTLIYSFQEINEKENFKNSEFVFFIRALMSNFKISSLLLNCLKIKTTVQTENAHCVKNML